MADENRSKNFKRLSGYQFRVPNISQKDIKQADQDFIDNSILNKIADASGGGMHYVNNFSNFNKHARAVEEIANDMKDYYPMVRKDRSPKDIAINYAGGYDWGSRIKPEELNDAIEASKAYQMKDNLTAPFTVLLNNGFDNYFDNLKARQIDSARDYLENVAGLKAAMADKESGALKDRDQLIRNSVIFGEQQGYAEGGLVERTPIMLGENPHYAEGGKVSTDDTALDDYAQLLSDYPEAQAFLHKFNEQNFEPTDSIIASTLAHPIEAAKRFGNKFTENVNTLMGYPDLESEYPLYQRPDSEKVRAALDLAGLAQTGALPFAPEDEVLMSGFKIPKRLITVNEPLRTAFPDIYARPDEIALKASKNVAPEDPALKQLFGVNRDDLYELRKTRTEGNEPPNIVVPNKPKGAKVAPLVMTRRNAQRIIDTLSEAEKYPELYKGMDAWYEMGPLFERFKQISDNPVEDFKRFQAITGMASPGSDVLTEINRGTAALNMIKQQRFEDFLKHGGAKVEGRYESSFPEDLHGVMGHPYHSTAQAIPMSKYLLENKVDMDSPKVPLYIQSAGVPETGFQIDLPVGDAHWSRGVGLADVRGGKKYDASVSMPELLSLGPWWREKIAKPLGTNAVNAQARAWGTFAPATGVTTPVGAPKLELIAQKIMDTARAYDLSPEEARDKLLLGEVYAPNLGLLEMFKKYKSGE